MIAARRLIAAQNDRAVNASARNYTLHDQYTTTLPSGSVNATAAEPGPGTRTVTDTWGLLSIGGQTGYEMSDQYTTARAAGAINGTAAEPGPGTRTITDTESKVTIA